MLQFILSSSAQQVCCFCWILVAARGRRANEHCLSYRQNFDAWQALHTYFVHLATSFVKLCSRQVSRLNRNSIELPCFSDYCFWRYTNPHQSVNSTFADVEWGFIRSSYCTERPVCSLSSSSEYGANVVTLSGACMMSSSLTFPLGILSHSDPALNANCFLNFYYGHY